jgi:Rv2632c-like
MARTLDREQLTQLAEVLNDTLRDMSHEIAATDNAHYRAGLLDRRRNLEEIRAAIVGGLDDQNERLDVLESRDERTLGPGWTIRVSFTENDDRTRADAHLQVDQQEWHGWGRARRNPVDPDIPAIGEELAAARALSDLSHLLVDAAAQRIEAFEGHPVHPSL